MSNHTRNKPINPEQLGENQLFKGIKDIFTGAFTNSDGEDPKKIFTRFLLLFMDENNGIVRLTRSFANKLSKLHKGVNISNTSVAGIVPGIDKEKNECKRNNK